MALKKKYWDQNTLLQELYKRSVTNTILVCEIKEIIFRIYLARKKNATTFLPFSFFWLSQTSEDFSQINTDVNVDFKDKQLS